MSCKKKYRPVALRTLPPANKYWLLANCLLGFDPEIAYVAYAKNLDKNQ